MKLQYISNHSGQMLGSCLLISTLLSGTAFADNSKDAFPPIPPEKKSSSVSTATPQAILPQQNGFYPQRQTYYQPQPMQGYRVTPYTYYYPQQPAYAPSQWNYYPQQRFATPYPNYQPPTQNQAIAYPTYPMGNQRPSYYPQNPAYQNNNAPRATGNNTGKTLYPMRKKIKKEKHSWGEKRHIWPDFYTGFTGDAWDKMINAPFDVGRMPGGWREPSLSTPDPATVSDAVANQVPPIMEEMGNMTNFAN